jgi:hypothetical protein
MTPPKPMHGTDSFLQGVDPYPKRETKWRPLHRKPHQK